MHGNVFVFCQIRLAPFTVVVLATNVAVGLDVAESDVFPIQFYHFAKRLVVLRAQCAYSLAGLPHFALAHFLEFLLKTFAVVRLAV